MRLHNLPRLALIALAVSFSVFSSGCGLFKKCGGCPSFSQRPVPVETVTAQAPQADRQVHLAP